MSEQGPRGDVTRLEVDGRTIVLVGTAHISQESVDAVREAIDHERPDVVCVELERFPQSPPVQGAPALDQPQHLRVTPCVAVQG